MEKERSDERKRRIPSLDFVRVVCTLGIIANHFAAESGSDILKNWLYTYPNGYGSIGYTLVTVFFLLSGGALFYSNGTPDSIRKFYWKRWKAIYPSYYVTFVLAMIAFILLNRSFFTGKKPWSLVFTVFGVDGYLSKVFSTWAIIGEWFIGALIICYLLYPLIVALMGKREVTVCLVLTGLYIITKNWNMLNQNAFRNVFSCLISFSAGIVLMKHRDKLDLNTTGMVSLLLLLLSAFLPIQQDSNIMAHMCGLWLFMVLLVAGRCVMKNQFCSALFRKGAKISFEVFLVHHVIVTTVLHFFHPENLTLQLLLLLTVIILSVACGWVAYYIRTLVSGCFSRGTGQAHYR